MQTKTDKLVESKSNEIFNDNLNFIEKPVLKTSDDTNIKGNREYAIFPIKHLNELLENSTLKNFRYLVDKNLNIWFSLEGRPGIKVPKHYEMTTNLRHEAKCVTAGNIKLDDNKNLVMVNNKSGDFEPSFDSIKWALAILFYHAEQNQLPFAISDNIVLEELKYKKELNLEGKRDTFAVEHEFTKEELKKITAPIINLYSDVIATQPNLIENRIIINNIQKNRNFHELMKNSRNEQHTKIIILDRPSVIIFDESSIIISKYSSTTILEHSLKNDIFQKNYDFLNEFISSSSSNSSSSSQTASFEQFPVSSSDLLSPPTSPNSHTFFHSPVKIDSTALSSNLLETLSPDGSPTSSPEKRGTKRKFFDINHNGSLHENEYKFKIKSEDKKSDNNIKENDNQRVIKYQNS